MIYHPDVNGRAASVPVKCHSEGQEVRRTALADIITRFNLPADIFG